MLYQTSWPPLSDAPRYHQLFTDLNFDFTMLLPNDSSKHWYIEAVLDLGLVFTESLGPRASTKVEFHASFTES